MSGVVGAASLPGGSGQVRCDGFDQAQMGITGDQAHAGQASGDQVSEELIPRRTGLAGGYAHPQYFAVSVIVDSGGNQNRARDDASSPCSGERVRVPQPLVAPSIRVSPAQGLIALSGGGACWCGRIR